MTGRKVIRLVHCCFAPCKKPGRWALHIKVYPRGILLPGMRPELLTRMNPSGTPPVVCEHHMLNMPARPIEFASADLTAMWDDWGRERYGAAFQGFNYAGAMWHFERVGSTEAVPEKLT